MRRLVWVLLARMLKNTGAYALAYTVLVANKERFFIKSIQDKKKKKKKTEKIQSIRVERCAGRSGRLGIPWSLG